MYYLMETEVKWKHKLKVDRSAPDITIYSLFNVDIIEAMAAVQINGV